MPGKGEDERLQLSSRHWGSWSIGEAGEAVAASAVAATAAVAAAAAAAALPFLLGAYCQLPPSRNGRERLGQLAPGDPCARVQLLKARLVSCYRLTTWATTKALLQGNSSGKSIFCERQIADVHAVAFFVSRWIH